VVQSTTAIVGVIAALSRNLPEPEHDFDRETLLLRTACATLKFTPPDVIEAMTVSLPVGNSPRIAGLRSLGRDVAGEYGLETDFDLVNTNLRMRITRPDGQAGGTGR
jgi:hypothetical protein